MDLLLEPHIKNKYFDLHVIVWYKLINIWRFLYDLCLIELTYSRGGLLQSVVNHWFIIDEI